MYHCPFMKTRISAGRFDEIVRWIGKTVTAAKVLLNTPDSGNKKLEYVIHFANKMLNAKRKLLRKNGSGYCLKQHGTT